VGVLLLPRSRISNEKTYRLHCVSLYKR
jgi:hypothetical protein